MKRILILFLIIPFFGIGQDSKTEYLNFKLTDNKDIIWQKVYQTESSLEELESFLLRNDFTSNLKLKDSVFVGRSGKSELSNKKNVAIAAHQKYDLFIKIEFKKNRYRVTLTDLEFDATESTVTSGMISIGSAIEYDLNDVSVREKHHEIRGNKYVRQMLATFDNDFNKHFIIHKVKEGESW